MIEKQRAVLATTVIALFIAAVFFVPWKIYDSNRVKWAPFYRNPITSESTLDESTLVTRFVRLQGERMYSVYILQLIAIGSVGAITFRLVDEKDA